MEWTEGGKVGPQGVGSMEAGVREALSSMGGGPEHCEVLDRLHGNWQGREREPIRWTNRRK